VLDPSYAIDGDWRPRWGLFSRGEDGAGAVVRLAEDLYGLDLHISGSREGLTVGEGHVTMTIHE